MCVNVRVGLFTGTAPDYPVLQVWPLPPHQHQAVMDTTVGRRDSAAVMWSQSSIFLLLPSPSQPTQWLSSPQPTADSQHGFLNSYSITTVTDDLLLTITAKLHRSGFNQIQERLN